MALTQVDQGLLGTNAQYTGFKNRIINGAMVIFQRGTAATTDSAYSVDRWRLVKSNDATESVSQNTDAPVGFSYSLRNTIGTGDAIIGSAQYSGFEQTIEGYNIADLGWGTANAKPITISFWVRSSVTGTYTGNVRNTNDTRINPFNFTISTANTWEQKTITVTGDTGGTWFTDNGRGIIFAVYAALGSGYSGGTAGTWGTTPAFGCGSPVNGIASNGNIFAISGVQLEKGSTATSFDYRPYGTELALCQRYYQVSENFIGGAGNTTSFTGNINFIVTMRASPTVGQTAVLSITDIANADFSQSSTNISITTGTRVTINAVSISANNFSGLTTNRPLISIPNVTGKVTLSSEL